MVRSPGTPPARATPPAAPSPQRRKVVAEVHVPITSRDGRAGGSPLGLRQVPGAPKWARKPRSDTQEKAKKLLMPMLWRHKLVLCLYYLL
jgi:hypothetical protein